MTTTDVTLAAGPRTRPRGGRILHRLLRNRAAVVALVFLGLLVVVAILSPWLTPYDPAQQNLLNSLEGPSAAHVLGTDSLGRDNLSKLIEGTRVTLVAVTQAMLLAVLLGIPTGLVAGHLGKVFDGAFSWISDILLSMPPLVLALAIVGTLGPGLTNAMVAVGIVFSPRFFRVARAAALSIRDAPYIEAARSSGCSTPRILLRHVLPNSSGPLLVQLSFSLGLAVVAEASLSFLGLGATPPTATWGSMIRNAFDNVYTSSFQLFAPSLMVVLTILATAVLGDALRDALGRQSRVSD